MLVHYNLQSKLILSVNASPVELGALILHESEHGERPIAFATRTLQTSERNYSQIDREALAIVFGVGKFHQYLLIWKHIDLMDRQAFTSYCVTKGGNSGYSRGPSSVVVFGTGGLYVRSSAQSSSETR